MKKIFEKKFVPWAILAHKYGIGIYYPKESQREDCTHSACSQREKKITPWHWLHFRTSSFMTQVKRESRNSLMKTSSTWQGSCL